jgi:hypothetical protein
MVISRLSRDQFQLKLSEQALVTLNNSLNEVINGLHVEEFHARIGVDEKYAKMLLHQISAALKSSE